MRWEAWEEYLLFECIGPDALADLQARASSATSCGRYIVPSAEMDRWHTPFCGNQKSILFGMKLSSS
jgi:hypothetical protein